MKYLYLLILLIGASGAAVQPQSQQGPVYRAAPTILNAANQKQQQIPQQQQQQLQQQQQQQQPAAVLPGPQAHTAEERESTGFVNNQDTTKVGSNGGVGGVVGIQSGATKTGTKTPSEQLYSVVWYPSPQTGAPQQYAPQPQQPQAGPYQQPATYQAQTGVGGAGSTGVSGGDYFSSFKWTDLLVGTAVLALVGVGSAMWYPKLVGLKARAMRELSELKSEDAARMAKNVMRAIQRFSEMNNGKQE